MLFPSLLSRESTTLSPRWPQKGHFTTAPPRRPFPRPPPPLSSPPCPLSSPRPVRFSLVLLPSCFLLYLPSCFFRLPSFPWPSPWPPGPSCGQTKALRVP